MQAAFALLPSAVVLFSVLGFKVSGLVAAMAAAVTAGGLWLCQVFSQPDTGQLVRAFADAGVLTILVAAMIVPGLVFVEATRGRNSPQAIRSLVQAIGVPRPQAAILIATGIGVVVESLTGMGVSLLVTIPLLLGLFDKRAAIGIGLVGMSLMPWGALSISAHVGAKLSGLPVELLQAWIAAVSGPVAFFLPALCLLFAGRPSVTDGIVALVAGAVLGVAIGLASRHVGVEVAGVAGGLAVIVLMMALAPVKSGLATALSAPGLRPYLILLAAVVAQKLAIAPLGSAGLAPVLDTGRVQFAILTSPGVALLVATLMTARAELQLPFLVGVARRAWRPVTAVALFMLAARLLVESGAIAELARGLGGLGRDGAAITVALLGAVGGFVTGSGVTGNALFMPSAAATGEVFGALGIFAALQNGASGHVGMASLPVAAILLASLPTREAGDDALIMRTALALAAWHVAVVILAGLALLRVWA
jgi:lactate permease